MRPDVAVRKQRGVARAMAVGRGTALMKATRRHSALVQRNNRIWTHTSSRENIVSFGWREVSKCFAAVLLVAAVAKSAELMTVPIIGVGVFDSKWLRFVVVEVELSLATLLTFWLSQIAPKS